MFDILIPRLQETMAGKSLAAFLEEATGISAKTYRGTGPKRASTIRRAFDQREQRARESMRNDGWPEAEIDSVRQYVNADGQDRYLPFSRLVRSCGQPGRFAFPHTLAVASSLDRLNSMLMEYRRADDLQGFRRAFHDERVLATMEEWLSIIGGDKDLLSIRQAARNPGSWDAWAPVIGGAAVMAYYQLIACWDVEFLSVYLTHDNEGPGLSPQPVVELFMPALKPGAKQLPDGTYPRHGLFILPLRRLLDFCFCLSVLHREDRWPTKKRVTRTQVAAAGGTTLQGESTDQPLAKIGKGLRGLSDQEFREIWESMIGDDESKPGPAAPFPWYVAAQILTLLFVERDTRRGTKSIVVPTPQAYRFWWDRYYHELKAKGVHFGTLPWPAYLRVDQSLSGIT